MNTQFLLLLASILPFLSCVQLTVNNDIDKDLERWELKGKVKYLEEVNYDFLYNVDLIDLNKPNFDRDFKISNTEQVFFNEQGMTEEHKSYRPIALKYRILQSFNDQGKPKSEIMYNEEGLVDYFTEMSYDDHGNLIEDVAFHYDSTMYIRKVFAYNELQQKTEQVNYRYDQKRWTRIFQYDKRGRVEIETFESEQNPSRRVHTYNRDGELSSIVFHQPDGTVIKEETYEYNSSDLFQKTMIDHLKEAKTIFRYNTEGFVFEDERWVMKNGVETLKSKSAQYRYDDKGNWIRRDSYDEDRLTYIHLRKIEYY